jgi:hypothetical protein
MRMQHQSFTDYLEELFMKDYIGTKDRFEDDFDRWLEEKDVAQMMDLGNAYGKQFKKK